jgi:uncharacterized protein YkwD
MMRIIALFYLLLQFSVGALAQGTKIDPANVDLDKLTRAIDLEVNKLRTRKRLDTLVRDEILVQAAQDHADYMTAEGAIGHMQKSKEKRTPYDRVVFYDGSHSTVGENVQMYPVAYEVKQSKNRLTYERLAQDMVKVWIKSKPHYKNLINPSFKTVGHALTMKDGMVYACEVFGSTPFVATTEYSKGEEIYIKKETPCFNCKRVQKKVYNDEVTIGWYTVSNDSIYYLNTKYYVKRRFYRKKKETYLLSFKRNNLNQVFSGNGQIAVDVVHQDQFGCDGKANFHNSPYYDGYYIGKVNKDMVKYQDLDERDAMVKVFVGMQPAFKDTFFQVDLNLVKKNRFCQQTSIVYVRPDYFEVDEYFTLPQAKIGADKKLIIQDSILIKIPFERNQTDDDETIFQPLITSLDSLVAEKHDISSIYFTGVASIEGTEQQNRKLFTKRGRIIENYIRKFYPTLKFQSEFYENFDDFKSGLVAVGYVDVTETSDDSLRLFANDFKDDEEIAAVLDQTRYSTVKIVFEDVIPVEVGSYGLSKERIDDLITENKPAEILPLYMLMANKAVAGDSVMQSDLSSISIPREEAYKKVLWVEFLYQLSIDSSDVDAEQLNELADLGAIKSDPDYLEYALLFNLFNEGGEHTNKGCR